MKNLQSFLFTDREPTIETCRAVGVPRLSIGQCAYDKERCFYFTWFRNFFFFLICMLPLNVEAARCIGSTPCLACKTCKNCAHCKVIGNSCGMCNKSKLTQTLSITPPKQISSVAAPLSASTQKRIKTVAMSALGPVISDRASIEVRFSPSGGIANVIIDEIAKAQKEIVVMAYAFTAAPIAAALKQAKARNVNVRVLLDRQQNKKSIYSIATLLKKSELEYRFEAGVTISHNKVIIVDGKTLMTGSYNFTTAAELHNAENFLIIRNAPEIIKAYQQNFSFRWSNAEIVTK